MRFGPYDLDPKSCELRKHGMRLKITGQPLQLLAFLLERPGELVSREDLRDRLWPENTFVDFEHSLNTAMKRLRRALEDDPERPQFVETVPRHGYRFIGIIEETRIEVPAAPQSFVAAPALPDATLEGTPVVQSEHRPLNWYWIVIPALVLALVGASAFYFLRGHPPAVTSIAVLPFVNANKDSNLDYLTDGLAGSIIEEVSHVHSINVVAWSLASRYRSVDPAEAGRTLRVSAVLTGTVARYGDLVVVRTELLDPATNRHLWGDEYKRNIADVLSIQSQINAGIAQHLRLQITTNEQQRLVTPHTGDPVAYDLYLKGRYYSAKGTREGLAKGLSYFQQATERDPKYAQAYSGLAFYYFVAMDWLLPPRDANEKARAAAEKALSLDDTLPEAHTMLGVVHWLYDWDWMKAESEFRRAIDLNPDYAPGHEFYGLFLASQGRGEEALRESRKAVALDPLSVELNTMLGQVLARNRQTDKSIEQFKKTIELDPNAWFPRLGLGFSYLQNHQFPEAIAELRGTIDLEKNPDVWGALGMAYGLAGKKAQALEVLQTLERQSRSGYVPPYDFAQVYIGVHDKDRAFEWLEEAQQERGFAAAWLGVTSETDSLRSDPRYADLLRKAGLSNSAVRTR